MKLYYKNNLLKEFDKDVTDEKIIDWCEENLLPKFDLLARTNNSFKRIGDKIIYENIITFTEFELK